MKALAIANSIPNRAMVLEEHAANTHENVQFVTQLIAKAGWRSALLVSSPSPSGAHCSRGARPILPRPSCLHRCRKVSSTRRPWRQPRADPRRYQEYAALAFLARYRGGSRVEFQPHLIR